MHIGETQALSWEASRGGSCIWMKSTIVLDNKMELEAMVLRAEKRLRLTEAKISFSGENK